MMPVRKLKPLVDAEDSLWRQIDSLWRMSARVIGATFPHGVYKHRTIGCANRLVERWEAERIAARAAR